MKWEKVKLGEIAQIIDGDRGVHYPKQNEFLKNGYCLFLNTGNVTEEGFCFDDIQFISKEKSDLLRKGLLERGDIVYTTRGTVGNAAYFHNNVSFKNIRINSGMVILRAKKERILPRYLFIILKSKHFRPYFKQFCTGSAQPQLPIKNLSKIEMNVPPLPIQESIADILSAYDDLIENNQKQIKLLEEAAQRLYKEWFVDFRFPGHETTPIVDGIPEGWEKKPAEVFFNITIGKTPPRAESKWFSDRREDIPWASISDMGQSGVYLTDTSEYLTREAVDVFNISTAPTGSVLLSFKLTVGRVRINSVPMCTNEAIAHFHIDDPVLRQYTFHYLSNFNYEELGNTSSISKAINSKKIKMMPFIMPTRNILEKYYHVANPIFESILVKQQEIASLKEARDRLLPKLMNGEIDVMEKAKKEMPSDRFDHIRRHWENVPYDPNQFALAARADGQLTEEEVKKLKDIAEEE